MAGHSKWSNTKHRKYAQDNKKSKKIMKLIKEITLATIKNGPNYKINSQLRVSLEKAQFYNVSKETIKRAIQRGQKLEKKNNLNKVKYAAYVPEGISLLIECNTDNSNRTVSRIRNILQKFNGYLVNKSSVEYLFHKYGILFINKNYKINKIINIISKEKIVDIIKTQFNIEIKVIYKNIKNIKIEFLKRNINIQTIKIKIEPKILQNINPENKIKFIKLISYLKKELPETKKIICNTLM